MGLHLTGSSVTQLNNAFAAQMATVSKTANYTAGAQEFVEVDASGGAVTITGPVAGAKRWGVKKVDGTASAPGNAVTVSYLNSAGSVTSLALTLAAESKIFRPSGSGYRVESGDTPKAALDFTYQGLNPKALVANLPNPFTIAHRGGPVDLAPEETMTSYKVSTAMGAHAIEIDVQSLADGTLVAMHDTTLDRTCTTTGNVSDQTAASWAKILINASGLTGETGWPSEGPPFVEQILRAYGNKVCIVPQPYDLATVKALDALIVALGIDKRTILMQSFDTQGELAEARLRGYPTMKLYGSGSAPDATAIAAMIALGTTHLCTNMDSMTSTVAGNIVAAGGRPSVFAPLYQFQRDQLTAMGVQGWFTDKPAWLMGVSPKTRTTDTFKSQSYSPVIYGTQGTRGAFATTNKLQLTTGSTHCMHVMECPTTTDPDNCTVTFDVTFTADGGSTSNAFYVGLMQGDFWSPDGRLTQDTMTITTANGYRFAMLTDAGSGTPLRGTKWTANVNVGNILTNGPGSYALNSKKSFIITVTPTTIKFEQVGQAGSVALSQSTYRQLRHLYFANAAGATVQVENIVWH